MASKQEIAEVEKHVWHVEVTVSTGHDRNISIRFTRKNATYFSDMNS